MLNSPIDGCAIGRPFQARMQG